MNTPSSCTLATVKALFMNLYDFIHWFGWNRIMLYGDICFLPAVLPELAAKSPLTTANQPWLAVVTSVSQEQHRRVTALKWFMELSGGKIPLALFLKYLMLIQTNVSRLENVLSVAFSVVCMFLLKSTYSAVFCNYTHPQTGVGCALYEPFLKPPSGQKRVFSLAPTAERFSFSV